MRNVWEEAHGQDDSGATSDPFIILKSEIKHSVEPWKQGGVSRILPTLGSGLPTYQRSVLVYQSWALVVRMAGPRSSGGRGGGGGGKC